MNRRGFIGSILALGVAPAIVRADSLMRLVPRDTTLLRYTYGASFPVREFVYGNVLVHGVGNLLEMTVTSSIGEGQNYATIQDWERDIPNIVKRFKTKLPEYILGMK